MSKALARLDGGLIARKGEAAPAVTATPPQSPPAAAAAATSAGNESAVRAVKPLLAAPAAAVT